jgi:hypothetical protein
MFALKRRLRLLAGLLGKKAVPDSCSLCKSQFRTALPLPNGGIACRRPIADRYITRAEAKKCTRLGVPPGFYDRLLHEDDWSFVIKLNALVEAACTDALAASLHAPELATCLATLDLGHSKQAWESRVATSIRGDRKRPISSPPNLI